MNETNFSWFCPSNDSCRSFLLSSKLGIKLIFQSLCVGFLMEEIDVEQFQEQIGTFARLMQFVFDDIGGGWNFVRETREHFRCEMNGNWIGYFEWILNANAILHVHWILVWVTLQQRFVVRKFGQSLRLYIVLLKCPPVQWRNHQILEIKSFVELEKIQQQLGASLLVACVVGAIEVEGEIETVDQHLWHSYLELNDWWNDWRWNRLQEKHEQPHHAIVCDASKTVAMVHFHPALDHCGQEIDSWIVCQQMRENGTVGRSDGIREVQAAPITRFDVQTIQDWRAGHLRLTKFGETGRFMQFAQHFAYRWRRFRRCVDVNIQIAVWNGNEQNWTNRSEGFNVMSLW